MVRRLTAEEAGERIPDLSAVLIDCVDGGACVGFLAPLGRERADRFWHAVADGVAAGDRMLFVAEERSDGTIVGTVQIVFARAENQPHRADVSKLLVRRSARSQGVGNFLMGAAEAAARAAGKTVLVLDTASGAAERLYGRLGWKRVGEVPDYALLPDGAPCATTFFYKSLAEA